MRKGLAVKTLSTLIILLFFLFWQVFKSPLFVHNTIVMDIESGWTATQVSASLRHHDARISAPLIQAWLRIKSWHSDIKAGEYKITPGMTLNQLADNIIHGHVLKHKITLVPGMTFTQVLNVLNNSQGLKSLVTHMTHAQLAKKLSLPQSSMEGQFYPDSYFYTKGDTDLGILKRAHRRWLSIITPIWAQQNHTTTKTLIDATTIASLLEKEAKYGDEKPIIAGVIHNRIKANMPIQIDASVIYGLGDRYQGRLRRRQLKIDTPYNTYLHRGLPPGPIALFTKDTLLAAIQPKQHDYFYYVANKEGRHLFATNFTAHKHNIKKVRAKS
jgi:UPF0755 protein